jgi:5-methylcytosine-specific restriction endonuclease McrA
MNDPKPVKAPRVSAQKYANLRRRAFERDQHVCVICHRARPLTAHHLIRRQDGGDVLHNLASLCGSGTTGCHGDVEHYRNGARQKLRAWVDATPEVLAYVLERKGEAWLEDRYPREERLAA